MELLFHNSITEFTFLVKTFDYRNELFINIHLIIEILVDWHGIRFKLTQKNDKELFAQEFQ